ncbi:MAG: hypothetical protein AB7E05_04070 [Sphingobium sp.]
MADDFHGYEGCGWAQKAGGGRRGACCAAAVPALMLLLLSACGGSSADQAANDRITAEKRKSMTAVACDLQGKQAFRDRCFIEWLPAKAGKGRDFLIHQADGGFRRFAISLDGTMVDVAEGAEPLDLVGPQGDIMTFRVGAVAYRMPVQALRPR